MLLISFDLFNSIFQNEYVFFFFFGQMIIAISALKADF